MVIDNIPSLQDKKIIIIDDEETICLFIKEILQAESFKVICAGDGDEGLKKIYEDSPDLIILDINMPKKNGFEVCRQIREDIFLRNIPVIMLTAERDEKVHLKGLDLDVEDYITKPVNINLLVARIRALLRRNIQIVSTSPLTGLPGNVTIVKEINKRINEGEHFALLNMDLNNFKSFNDYYGFAKGDEVIKFASNCILKSLQYQGSENDFLGHIGGDDFIALTSPWKVEKICKSIIEKFDVGIPDFYLEADRKRKFIVTKDRQGYIMQFPFVSISIAAATTFKKKYAHSGEIMEIITEIKKLLKSEKKGQSEYVIDRRHYKSV